MKTQRNGEGCQNLTSKVAETIFFATESLSDSTWPCNSWLVIVDQPNHRPADHIFDVSFSDKSPDSSYPFVIKISIFQDPWSQSSCLVFRGNRRWLLRSDCEVSGVLHLSCGTLPFFNESDNYTCVSRARETGVPINERGGAGAAWGGRYTLAITCTEEIALLFFSFARTANKKVSRDAKLH